jgi:hypothetical protein
MIKHPDCDSLPIPQSAVGSLLQNILADLPLKHRARDSTSSQSENEREQDNRMDDITICYWQRITSTIQQGLKQNKKKKSALADALADDLGRWQAHPPGDLPLVHTTQLPMALGTVRHQPTLEVVPLDATCVTPPPTSNREPIKNM